MNEKEVSIVNRIGTWAVLAGLGVYMLNIGSWVGAADEKFEQAQKVEEQVDDIKERITTLEAEVKNLDENSKTRAEAIVRAIEKLEEKIEDGD